MRKLCAATAASISLLTASLHAAAIPTFAAADLVLGQPNFTSSGLPAPPTASSLNEPSSAVVDPATGKVFIADTQNNRILRFANRNALTNGSPAEFVFGQPNFTSSASAFPPTAASLNGPYGLWIDAGNRLWVADADNLRVIMYRSASSQTTNGPAADLVLGQPDFTSTITPPTPAANSLKGPLGVTVDSAGRLWVADSGNNRVLRFDSAASLGNHAAASGVLGQATFTTSAAGSDQLGLNIPTSVAVDATGTLWVADSQNSRVFGYPSAATISNGTNAARVIGQPDFNTIAPAQSASRLSFPTGLFADSENSLWVLDQASNRALRFANLSSINNGSPASTVVGQADFTTGNPGLDSRRFNAPFVGISVDFAGSLWVADTANHRILRFDREDSEAPTVRIQGRKKFTTKRPRIKLRGTAADDIGVTAVTIKPRKKNQSPALGTTTWQKRVRLRAGSRNVFKAFAFDAIGQRSLPARVVIIRK